MALARSPHLVTAAGPALTPLVTVILGASLLIASGAGARGPGEPAGPPQSSPSASPSSTPTPAPTARPSASPRPTATPREASPTASPTATPTPSPIPTAPPVVTPVPATPAPPPPPSGPPACTYADVLTPHHALSEWQITLLDTVYHLPSTYAPGDLVDSSAAGLNGGYAIRSLMLVDLAALAADASAAGAPIQLVSGYRSYAQQKATFDHWVAVGGYEQALRTSARPGHSEHQLGTAIDVTSLGGTAPWEYADWASTPAGAWMAQNAWRYGFVMSYPRGASELSCYDYEPWHYRYVGRELAAQVAASGAILRLMLWERQ